MKTIKMGAIGVLLSLILFTVPAQAIPITRADFPDDAINLNFDELPNLTVVNTQYQGLGVTFSGGNFVISLAPNNSQVLSISSSLIATFNTNVDIVGVDIVSSIPITLVAYDYSGNPIESVTGAASGGFLGLSTGGIPISRVNIHDTGGSFNIDNFTFGDPTTPVPEPATLILLGSGLISLGLLGRKKFITKA